MPVGTVVGEGGPGAPRAVRYREVVAMLDHQSAGRRPAHLSRWTACLDCAGHLLEMVAEGTFPNVADLALSRSSPGWRRFHPPLDVDGVVTFASPNAISAYHRMGLTELGHATSSGSPVRCCPTRSGPGNWPTTSAPRCQWRLRACAGDRRRGRRCYYPDPAAQAQRARQPVRRC